MKAYLAGAIEHAPDHGNAWRNEIAAFLKNELNHDCFNPLINEYNLLSDRERRVFRSLKKTDLIGFKKIVRKIMKKDLKIIAEEIDYIICYWDVHTEKGGGTQGELTLSFYLGIPVYMVTECPVAEISGWIIGCTTKIFSNFNELKYFLLDKYLDI